MAVKFAVWLRTRWRGSCSVVMVTEGAVLMGSVKRRQPTVPLASKQGKSNWQPRVVTV
jgi:hypothetical protein